MFECKHKFEKVDQDGYQYCIHCGKASLPPVIPCSHEWKEVSSYARVNPLARVRVQTSFVYIYRCIKCVEMKEVDTKDLKTNSGEN